MEFPKRWMLMVATATALSPMATSEQLSLGVINITIPQVDYEQYLSPGFFGMPALDLKKVNYSKIIAKMHTAVVMGDPFR